MRSEFRSARAALVAAACVSLVPSLARAQSAETSAAEEVALTVYSSADPTGFDPQQFAMQQRMGWNPWAAWQVPGYGVVKEVRRIALPAGTADVRITDVAEFIDPTTVSFADLDAPQATGVLEQVFQFDLVSPSKLLERYVDHEVDLVERRIDGSGEFETSVRGTVLSANQGQVVLRMQDGSLRFVGATDANLRLPSLPEGLVTRPTLAWKVVSDQAGTRRVRTTYQTGGLTWRADYNVVIAGDAKSADVGAWVTLLNMSGASYRNAALKLVAGDVQRIQSGGGWDAGPTEEVQTLGAAVHGFDEKSFFEYHLYTLPRKTDVLANSTQQLALFPTATGVGVRKVLVYFGLPDAAQWGVFGNAVTERDLGTQSNPKVDVYLEIPNREANRLGRPLPKGKLRVYQRDDADGTLEFVGEDLIDHTPRDETVRVKLGQSFDVVGERKQTDFRVNTGRKEMVETFSIELRNHKDEAVDVLVREVLYRWTNWEITQKSDAFEKQDSRTIHFPVSVPAHGTKQVTYTVRYTW